MTGRVDITEPAAATVRRLAAVHGPVVMHLSGGCCDGSSPMCLPAAELPPGPGDTQLGEVAGAPVYIDAEQDRRWGHPALLIDVLPGAATSLSLEGADDCHFVSVAPPPPLRAPSRGARRRGGA
jgi:uncharacterized protein (DUF779 family)